MMTRRPFFLPILVLSLFFYGNVVGADREKMLRDSTIKYGVNIEPYLKSLNNNKIVEGFNYSPHINKFLKEHKYVKFPAYLLTVGIDDSFPGYKSHIVVSSGNRIYFPKGSSLVCPADLKTNGYMVFIAWNVRDVFIDGINLTGGKANPGYVTSPYGAGIAMYAPTNVLISNATIKKNTGDGLTVRTQWGKQCENITINKAVILNSTRVGMLVTGINNGVFRNIYIEGTGEKVKEKIVKPQTGLSFEPNDCTSKYINCRFYNLETKNNLGPVVATTNFYNIFVKNTCGVNKIDIKINNWKDFSDDPACYGASFDVACGDMQPYDTKDLSGTFEIINPTLIRNIKDNYYFFHGQEEKRKGGVVYKISNLKLIHQGVTYTNKNKEKYKKIQEILNSANTSNKILIR
ncbi:MAG: right-handed parallel beta-helix repeat-containing protein [Dyadobacter sp.]|uniref:right-handed parallel beta-helix repeat-containing protein n=1 Tax=Dyadobacter sp. TaxID=1914288 RepID=UPI0032662615